MQSVRLASRCYSRRCPSCGVLWAGDQRVKLLRNIQAYDGDGALVTVTAPGKDVLPFGEDGRTVQKAAARRWNKAATQEARKLRRKATQRADRLHRKNGGDGWRRLASTWEFQKRGVLHFHDVVPMGSALDRIASQLYADTLAEMAPAHGFGFVDRGRRHRAGTSWSTRRLEVVPKERLSRYVAKYIAGVKADGKLALSETVRHGDVPPHVTHVSRRLTGRTRCTMRTLRLHRRAYMVRGHLIDSCNWNALEAIDALDMPDEDIVRYFGQKAGP